MATDGAACSAAGLSSPARPALTRDINCCIAADNAVRSAGVTFVLKKTVSQLTTRLLLLEEKTEDSTMDLACD
jgi:hypothetical protein